MLESFLFEIDDSRRKQGLRYPELAYILLFAIFAILCGGDSYRDIHSFIKVHLETLKEKFNLKWKRSPAYTTIRNIIQSLSSNSVEKAFRKYSAGLAENNKSKKRFIAFDGKTLRGSFDNFNDKSAIQILSAFLVDSKIILAHEEIEEKTNEIPTAQDLIKKLGLEDCIFTFDAMNCQQKTLETAKDTNNNVIVQVKANQKFLLEDCLQTSKDMPICDVYEEPLNEERNRREKRKVEVFNTSLISDLEKWNLVKAIVKVKRHREIFDTKKKCWKNSGETAFYISTVVLSAEDFCKAIRNHWKIENCNHYVRDVSMQEDKSRIRVNANIFAKLRSFALNIMRANNTANVKRKLFENCLDLENILNYTGIK